MRSFSTSVDASRIVFVPSAGGIFGDLTVAVSQLIGIGFMRQIIGLDTLEQATIEELVTAATPAIQTYLDCP